MVAMPLHEHPSGHGVEETEETVDGWVLHEVTGTTELDPVGMPVIDVLVDVPVLLLVEVTELVLVEVVEPLLVDVALTLAGRLPSSWPTSSSAGRMGQAEVKDVVVKSVALHDTTEVHVRLKQDSDVPAELHREVQSVAVTSLHDEEEDEEEVCVDDGDVVGEVVELGSSPPSSSPPSSSPPSSSPPSSSPPSSSPPSSSPPSSSPPSSSPPSSSPPSSSPSSTGSGS
jgi:hypothetical protein